MNHSIMSRRAEGTPSRGESNFSRKSKLRMFRSSSKAGIIKRLEGRHCKRMGSCKKAVAVSPISSFYTEGRAVSPIKPFLSSEQLENYDDMPVDKQYGGGKAVAVFRTFLWLFICSHMTGGTFGAEPFIPPTTCKYPDPVEYAAVKPLSPTTRGGLYPNGSRAHVDCYSNFRVKYGDPSLTCVNGDWVGVTGRPVECELLHTSSYSTTCGNYPKIEFGFYAAGPDEPAGNTFQEETYPVGAESQADCIPTYTLNCTHPYRHLCGRISCQSDGRWVPRDGNLVTGCVPKPAVLTVNGDDDRHGPKTSSSLKNYLVLALVLVCIFVAGALTVALLRRPLFCKKREQNSGDGPVVITSSSPNHPPCGSDLDSLPVAMNTGIFLPGAGYDLQDCQMQDVPFVGTTVFK